MFRSQQLLQWFPNFEIFVNYIFMFLYFFFPVSSFSGVFHHFLFISIHPSSAISYLESGRGAAV